MALISGISGIASTFSWIGPLRPYLIGTTVLVLSFAWYQKLKPKKEIECNCENEEKPKFIQSKLFLGLVTGFAILMLAFPFYNNIFYPEKNKEIVNFNKSNVENIELDIEGMTCTSCLQHIDFAVNELNGIVNIKTSFENGNALIAFDKSKTSVNEIESAINSTGYKVTKNN